MRQALKLVIIAIAVFRRDAGCGRADGPGRRRRDE